MWLWKVKEESLFSVIESPILDEAQAQWHLSIDDKGESWGFFLCNNSPYPICTSFSLHVFANDGSYKSSRGDVQTFTSKGVGNADGWGSNKFLLKSELAKYNYDGYLVLGATIHRE